MISPHFCHLLTPFLLPFLLPFFAAIFDLETKNERERAGGGGGDREMRSPKRFRILDPIKKLIESSLS